MGKNSQMGQHKRMAMGESVGFARGGPVPIAGAARGPNPMPVGAGAMVPRSAGLPGNPLTTAKRNNGVPGLCKGGAMKKGGKMK